MIADAERAIAIAGIMGGENTEIGEATTDVLLEAANFEPTGIYRSSERLRLRTEGSNRWEKGVDPHLAEQAARLATRADRVDRRSRVDRGTSTFRASYPQRPGDLFPARACRRADRHVDAGCRADGLARASRLRSRERRGRGAHISRARRDARGRRRRGGRPAPARGGAVHAARRGARCSARSRRCSAFAVASRTSSPASGSPRRTRRRFARTIRIPTRRGPPGADLGRARRPAHTPPAEPRRGSAAQRRAGRRGHRAVRGRPRLSARHGDLPDEHTHVAGIVEGGW